MGRVLTGNLASNVGTFERRHMITSSGTWLVPDGVTQICIHACGGGGAGNISGGGASGTETYWAGTVTPGSLLTIAIGAGGIPDSSQLVSEFWQNTPATGGGTTTVSCGAVAAGGAAGGIIGTHGSGGMSTSAAFGIMDGLNPLNSNMGLVPGTGGGHTLNGGPAGRTMSSIANVSLNNNSLQGVVSIVGATGGGGSSLASGGVGGSGSRIANITSSDYVYGHTSAKSGRLGSGGGGGVLHDGQKYISTGGSGGSGWVIIYY